MIQFTTFSLFWGVCFLKSSKVFIFNSLIEIIKKPPEIKNSLWPLLFIT